MIASVNHSIVAAVILLRVGIACAAISNATQLSSTNDNSTQTRYSDILKAIDKSLHWPCKPEELEEVLLTEGVASKHLNWGADRINTAEVSEQGVCAPLTSRYLVLYGPITGAIAKLEEEYRECVVSRHGDACVLDVQRVLSPQQSPTIQSAVLAIHLVTQPSEFSADSLRLIQAINLHTKLGKAAAETSLMCYLDSSVPSTLRAAVHWDPRRSLIVAIAVFGLATDIDRKFAIETLLHNDHFQELIGACEAAPLLWIDDIPILLNVVDSGVTRVPREVIASIINNGRMRQVPLLPQLHADRIDSICDCPCIIRVRGLSQLAEGDRERWCRSIRMQMAPLLQPATSNTLSELATIIARSRCEGSPPWSDVLKACQERGVSWNVDDQEFVRD